MKVSNLLSYLFTISVAIATPTLNLRKRKVTTSLSKECEQELEKYEECYYGDYLHYYTKDEIDDCCLPYHFDKCKTLREKGIKSIPECKNEDAKNVEIENEYIKIANLNSDFVCAKSEYTNNYCPIIQWLYESLRINATVNEEKFFYESVNETCYSKNCRDAFVHYVVNFNETLKEVLKFRNSTEYKNYVERLRKKNKKNKSKRYSFYIENFNECGAEILFNKTAQHLIDNCINKNIQKSIDEDSDDSSFATNISHTQFIPVLFLIFVLSLLF